MSGLPASVRSERFSLPLVTRAEAAGERGARWHPEYPRAEDVDAFSLVTDEGTDAGSWGPRHVVRRVDGLVIGSIGFFGPPGPGPDGTPEAEVGFGLVPYARGHGVATECLAALLAETDRLGVAARAATAPGNAAALRVLARAGFTGLRGSDEDGQLVLARTVPR